MREDLISKIMAMINNAPVGLASCERISRWNDQRRNIVVELMDLKSAVFGLVNALDVVMDSLAGWHDVHPMGQVQANIPLQRLQQLERAIQRFKNVMGNDPEIKITTFEPTFRNEDLLEAGRKVAELGKLFSAALAIPPEYFREYEIAERIHQITGEDAQEIMKNVQERAKTATFSFHEIMIWLEERTQGDFRKTGMALHSKEYLKDW